jgi:hypothetical protein
VWRERKKERHKQKCEEKEKETGIRVWKERKENIKV